MWYGRGMKITRAVVPVAGRGTRMRPLTLYQPKELLPVGQRPALSYLVDELAGSGIRDILLITSAEKQAIEALFAATPFISWEQARTAPPAEVAPPAGPRIWSVR